MIFAAVGTPSPVAHWGVHVLRVILEIAVGPVELIAHSRMESFEEAWKQRTAEHTLLFVDSPDAEVAAFLMNLRVPIVAFAEDPVEVAAYSMIERSIDWKSAARLTSLVFSSLHDFFTSPDTLLICRSSEQTVGALVGQLVDHFGVSLTDLARHAILLRICADGADPLERVEVNLLKSLALSAPVDISARQPQLHILCSPYRSLLYKQSVDEVRWPLEIFSGKNVDEPPSQTIEMVGGGRFLFFGPYLHLPPGKWTLRFEFGVRRNVGGNTLRVDVFSGTMIVGGDAPLPFSGTFSLNLDFEVNDATKAYEFRALMMFGALDGTFLFDNVFLARMG